MATTRRSQGQVPDNGPVAQDHRDAAQWRARAPEPPCGTSSSAAGASGPHRGASCINRRRKASVLSYQRNQTQRHMCRICHTLAVIVSFHAPNQNPMHRPPQQRYMYHNIKTNNASPPKALTPVNTNRIAPVAKKHTLRSLTVTRHRQSVRDRNKCGANSPCPKTREGFDLMCEARLCRRPRIPGALESTNHANTDFSDFEMLPLRAADVANKCARRSWETSRTLLETCLRLRLSNFWAPPANFARLRRNVGQCESKLDRC